MTVCTHKSIDTMFLPSIRGKEFTVQFFLPHRERGVMQLKMHVRKSHVIIRLRSVAEEFPSNSKQ
jgi:hypothetical protein